MSPIKLFKRKTTIDELLTIDDLKDRNIKLGSITMKDKKTLRFFLLMMKDMIPNYSKI